MAALEEGVIDLRKPVCQVDIAITGKGCDRGISSLEKGDFIRHALGARPFKWLCLPGGDGLRSSQVGKFVY